MHAIYENIPALSIFLMMLSGILTVLCHKGRAAYRIFILSMAALIAGSLWLLAELAAGGYEFTYSMGVLGAPWGNELRAGPLEALLAAAFSLVMLLSVLGGREDIDSDILPEKQGLYYIMLDLMMASLLALIYTNDVFTGYVFIEINTITACAMVMAKDEGRTLAATVRYLIMSLVGSSLFLMSVALLYGVTGHLLMESLAPAIDALMTEGRYLLPLAALAGMMTVGLSIKSALYPFSSWLPDAHGTATTSSSAILSGLVIKGYIVLLIKIYVRCFGLEHIRAMGLDTVLFILGAVAMIAGSIQAIRETHIKRMIAYSSVAQVGYIFMAMGMGTQAGMVAAFYQMIVHAFTKPLIFVSAGGLIGVSGHNKQLYDLGGSALRNPLAGIGFSVGGLAFVGIPLLSAFAAKLIIANEAAAVSGWQTPVALAALGLSGVLNALYYLPAMLRVWLPDGGQREKAQAVSPRFAVASVALMAAVVALGIWYEPLARLLGLGVSLY